MVMRDMITGEVLFRTQAKGAMAERFGAGWFQIHRADLLDILTSALGDADIRLNASCVAVEPAENGATVEIGGGGGELFGVVGGGDGNRSLGRAALYSGQSGRFTGHMCCGSVGTSRARPAKTIVSHLT